MQKKTEIREITFEAAEIETCLGILNKPFDERNKDETSALLSILHKFEFFSKMPYKYAEIKEQETHLLMEKCSKYMTPISFNSQELLTERGKKIEYIYIILKGKLGLFAKKTPQEIQNELEKWRKTQHATTTEENFIEEGQPKQKHLKVTFSTLKKLSTLNKLNVHSLGSLAKENAGKFHVKGNIYTIKEVDEVRPGFHIFEGSISASSQISEHTILAKEPSVVIAISVSDYQKAVQEVKTLYKNRYKLLQKSFLTSDEVPLNKIAMYFVEHTYGCNETIFNEGDKGEKLYCVASGEIHLLQSRTKRDTVARAASYLYGYTNLIDTILLGDFFGDEWFYEEKERRYTAMAKYEGTVVLSLDPALLARLCSHHPEMGKRLRNLLAMRREVRRKKVDPLDKKRARDYYVNLAEFKSVLRRNPSSPNLAKHSDNLKLSLTSPKKKLENMPDVSPKIANMQGSETIQKLEKLQFTPTNLSTPRDSSPYCTTIDNILSPNSKFSKPAFKFNPPFSTHTRKLHTRTGSLDPEAFKHSKQSLDFIGSSPKDPIKKIKYSSLSGNNKVTSRANMDSNQKTENVFNFTEAAGSEAVIEKQWPLSVKEQVDTLASISNQLAQLSTMIRIQRHHMETIHGTSHLVSHKPTRSVHIRSTLPKYWADDESSPANS